MRFPLFRFPDVSAAWNMIREFSGEIIESSVRGMIRTRCAVNFSRDNYLMLDGARGSPGGSGGRRNRTTVELSMFFFVFLLLNY